MLPDRLELIVTGARLGAGPLARLTMSRGASQEAVSSKGNQLQICFSSSIFQTNSLGIMATHMQKGLKRLDRLQAMPAFH